MTVQEQQAASGGLVLESLRVKNFRAFRDLTIPKLGRVNLITGRNDVGKTTLLESIFFYARGGYPYWIRTFLNVRNEISLQNQSSVQVNDKRFKSTYGDFQELTNVRFLFHGRRSLEEPIDSIEIGDVDGHADSVQVSFAWQIEDKSTPITASGRPLIPIPASERVKYPDAEPYIVVRISDYFSVSYPLEQVIFGDAVSLAAPRALPCQFVLNSSANDNSLPALWDAIALSDMEVEVTKAVQLIEPEVERISFVGGDARNERGRFAVAKIKGVNDRIPLRSLGDGMNRLLAIALNIVASKDGIALIDEIENGIHYSVLPEVWRFIFQLASKLNVQVFATTHSWDCIEAFQQASVEDENPNSGVLTRLRNKSGNVITTVFDEEELAGITRYGIEVR